MATANNKRIEETAIAVLKSALLRCPILDSYISSNDKTPSWDGNVFVYKNEEQKKEDIIGNAPIQVKGTEKQIVSSIATFSCKISDLKNYYNNGGCIFFLVSVAPATGESKIYYSSLLVYDLKKILDAAKSPNSTTIKLKEFPENDINEISAIFLNFVQNSKKQMSFIGKELNSLDKLIKSGVNVESLNFNISGIESNIDIGHYITTHDFYLYAKPKGLDVDIPVEKIHDAIFSKTVDGNVLVGETEYYSSYNVEYRSGIPTIKIGKGISINLSEDRNRITTHCVPAGLLKDVIQDTRCFIDIIEKRELTLNGAKFVFRNDEEKSTAVLRKKLEYYCDVKKTLDILGVTEELQVDSISEQDDKNIRTLINAILYNKKVTFSKEKENPTFGPLKIANLVIWIWMEKEADGQYWLKNFFTSHPIAAFFDDDIKHEHPVPASHYLLLGKDAFNYTSNMNYDLIKSSICSMKHELVLQAGTINLMLNILRGYDMQARKDDGLLNLANAICEWLKGYGDNIDPDIIVLNQFQIIKRMRKLSTSETLTIGKLTSTDHNDSIRCGAYLLLEDSEEAQKCFDRLDEQTQKEFVSYPISVFGNLKLKEQ